MFRMIGTIAVFQVGIMAANLARVKVLALEVGPAGVGLQSLVEQIMTLVALFSTFSLPFASVKFLSFAHSDDRIAFARVYAAFLRSLVLLSLVGAAISIVVAFAWPDLFGGDVAEHRQVLVIALLSVPLINVITLVTNALAAAQRPRASAAYTLVRWGTVAALGIAGVIVDGLRGYFVGIGVGTLIVLLGGLRYLRRAEGTSAVGPGVRIREELRRYPGILSFSALQSVLAFSTPVAFVTARYSVLGEKGLVGAGLLAATFGIAQGLSSLLNPANALFLTPRMNRNEPATAKFEQAVRFRTALLVIAGFVVMPIVLFPKLFLTILYSSGFTDAAPFLFLFVVAEYLLIMGNVNQALLIGLDDVGINVGMVLAGQALMCGLFFALVPVIGVAGVGAGLAAGYALVLALTSWRLWHRHRMPVLQTLGSYPLAALVLLAGIGALVPTLPEGSAAVVAAKCAVLAGFGATSLWFARRPAAAATQRGAGSPGL